MDWRNTPTIKWVRRHKVVSALLTAAVTLIVIMGALSSREERDGPAGTMTTVTATQMLVATTISVVPSLTTSASLTSSGSSLAASVGVPKGVEAWAGGMSFLVSGVQVEASVPPGGYRYVITLAISNHRSLIVDRLMVVNSQLVDDFGVPMVPVPFASSLIVVSLEPGQTKRGTLTYEVPGWAHPNLLIVSTPGSTNQIRMTIVVD